MSECPFRNISNYKVRVCTKSFLGSTMHSKQLSVSLLNQCCQMYNSIILCYFVNFRQCYNERINFNNQIPIGKLEAMVLPKIQISTFVIGQKLKFGSCWRSKDNNLKILEYSSVEFDKNILMYSHGQWLFNKTKQVHTK